MKNIKIICVSLILLMLSGAGVMAVTTQRENVKIALANGYEMTVLTSKTKVSEILSENNIVLTEEEKVSPNLDEELSETKKIIISNKTDQEIQIAKISEEGVKTSLDELLKGYSPIIEKIVVEQVAIPFETITKDVSEGSDETRNRVIREGEDGLKEVTYKIKYQNDKEIEKIVLSEQIIKEPVDKIIQVRQVSTSRAATIARADEGPVAPGRSAGVYKITGYCSCARCCGKTSGRTASGTIAAAGRTVAASAALPFGTQVNINGHTYTVEDRGGAIKGNKIDIFFSTHAEALAWGVRYLPVEIVD